ncbi:hypothetical protein MA16_Dca022258 [Dendrobium catenatum]|uniref:Protein RFT1 homolog n=1 Tax=Dendrobium catenatum TaxID=906689 RepID=A0A2I0W2Y1_9ASPA|nr:hypothetical protein MA16_Dca022258 [Dendrobium catenatum]
MASEKDGSWVDGGSAANNSFGQTFKYLMATQFLSRLIPFIFNTWIVRHLTEADYALYAVKFHLLTTCILFLSREGFRRACMRIDIQCDGMMDANAARLLKIAWLTIPLGILFTSALCSFFFWIEKLSFQNAISDPNALAILINGFACILELLGEPLYILSQNLLLLKLRLMVETVATIARCMMTCTLMFRSTGMEMAIIFAVSQVSYGACLALGYWIYFLSFGIISSSFLFPFRLVFSPFEESSYTTFAKVASGDSPQKMMLLANSLTEALKLVSLIGLAAIAFGPSYSYCLIRLLYGKKWSDGQASTVLSCYCFYIISLAVNGTSESFLHAVANESQLIQSNLSLFLFSGIYILLNIIFVRSAGAFGLIAANSINMILRITYSALFIRRYFKGSSFSFLKSLPSGWIVLLLSGAVTLASEKLVLDRENFWHSFLIHLSIGLLCFCISAIVMYGLPSSMPLFF